MLFVLNSNTAVKRRVIKRPGGDGKLQYIVNEVISDQNANAMITSGLAEALEETAAEETAVEENAASIVPHYKQGGNFELRMHTRGA
jgi:hypothetical protein